MDDGIRRGGPDEFRTESQGPATAGRFDRPDPTARQCRMLGSENEPLHRLVEPGITGRRDVGFRRLAREYGLLGLAHGLENRRIPLVIAIDTHAEVDLVRVGIGAKGGHQAENRIGGQPVEALEHVLGLRTPRELRGRPKFNLNRPVYPTGGMPVYCGRSSVIGNHWAFEFANPCPIGRVPGSPSSVPAGTTTRPTERITRGRVLPHCRQNAVPKCQSFGGP